jgi:hypothetical protein
MKYSLEAIQQLILQTKRCIWCLRRNGHLVSEGEEDNETIYDSLITILQHVPHGEYVLELRTAKNSNRNLIPYKFDWGESVTKNVINGINDTSPQLKIPIVDNQYIIGELEKERTRNERLQKELRDAVIQANEYNTKLQIIDAVDRRMSSMPAYEPPANWVRFAELAATGFGNMIGHVSTPYLAKAGLLKTVGLSGTEEDADINADTIIDAHFKGYTKKQILPVLNAFLSNPEIGSTIKEAIIEVVKGNLNQKNKIGFQ